MGGLYLCRAAGQALAVVSRNIQRDPELSPSPAVPTESHPGTCLARGNQGPRGCTGAVRSPRDPSQPLEGFKPPQSASALLGWETPASPQRLGGCGGPQVTPGPTCSCSAACGSRSSAAAAASPAWCWTGSSPAAASRCATSGSAPAPGAEGSVGVSSRGYTVSSVSPGSWLPGAQPWCLCPPAH